jgi:carboxyl-terminal processing protease
MSPRVRLTVAFVSTGLIGYIALGSVLGRVRGDSTYGQLAVFNEVVRIVLEAYVDPVNLDRTMAGARLGLTEALDGDSAYLEPEEFRAYQQPSKDDGDVGLLLSRRFSFLMVVSARAGSPAEKSGVKPGDIIKTIDGRHTRPLPAPVGQRLLRGAPGSVVKLTLLRAGSDPIDLSLVRERLTPAPPRSRVLEDGAGYLKVPEFQARVADDIRGELLALRRGGARTLVLDLRDSGEGVPAEAVKVAELFLHGGVVSRLKGAKVPEQVLTADPARSAWDLPMAVLVDTGTAGPAEIVAAALLDAGRAPLVGEHTFGRAAVQKAVPLADGGLVVTVGKYVTPKGNAIHGKGLEPSVPVERAPEDAAEEGEPARDLILEKALEVLKEEAGKKKAA